MSEVRCRCFPCYIARLKGDLLYSERWGGWIFPADKPRHASDLFKLSYYSIEDHTDEPYVWTHNCPFCGKDFPPDDWSPYEQSDGCAGDGPE